MFTFAWYMLFNPFPFHYLYLYIQLCFLQFYSPLLSSLKILVFNYCMYIFIFNAIIHMAEFKYTILLFIFYLFPMFFVPMFLAYFAKINFLLSHFVFSTFSQPTCFIHLFFSSCPRPYNMCSLPFTVYCNLTSYQLMFSVKALQYYMFIYFSLPLYNFC